MIKLNVICDNPYDAIREAGNLLAANGYCTEQYIERMIECFDIYGDYIVVDEHIAMPHARPEDGAIKSGFSIVTLKEPIKFGHEDNDPVSIVFGLVGATSDEHVNTIKKLATLCDSKDFIATLMKSTSEQEIINLLN